MMLLYVETRRPEDQKIEDEDPKGSKRCTTKRQQTYGIKIFELKGEALWIHSKRKREKKTKANLWPVMVNNTLALLYSIHFLAF